MTSISPKIPIVNKIHKAAIIGPKRNGVINILIHNLLHTFIMFYLLFYIVITLKYKDYYFE